MSQGYGSRPFDLSRAKRRRIGWLLLGTSAVLFSISVLAASTDLFKDMGMANWQSWEVAGLTGGVALPIAFAGVFILLPATQTERRLATAGSAIAMVGVWLFKQNFPNQWHGDPVDNTFFVVATYFIGVFMAFFALFVSVSNFEIPEREVIVKKVKTEARNAVGADTSDTDEYPRRRRERPSRSRRRASKGGVGVFGGAGIDDNDGQEEEPQPGGAEIMGDESERRPETGSVDRYCGNCDHFEYQRVGNTLRPVCTLADEAMDDLQACEEWQHNGSEQLDTDGW